MLHMSFKSFEDVILDEKDSLWSCFVTTAKWYHPKLRISLFLEIGFVLLHSHVEQYVSSSICFQPCLCNRRQTHLQLLSGMFSLDRLANNGQSSIKKKPVYCQQLFLIHISCFETPEGQMLRNHHQKAWVYKQEANNMLKVLQLHSRHVHDIT